MTWDCAIIDLTMLRDGFIIGALTVALIWAATAAISRYKEKTNA